MWFVGSLHLYGNKYVIIRYRIVIEASHKPNIFLLCICLLLYSAATVFCHGAREPRQSCVVQSISACQAPLKIFSIFSPSWQWSFRTVHDAHMETVKIIYTDLLRVYTLLYFSGRKLSPIPITLAHLMLCRNSFRFRYYEERVFMSDLHIFFMCSRRNCARNIKYNLQSELFPTSKQWHNSNKMIFFFIRF